MAGLYFHIPFCRSKCGYCDFVSYPVGAGQVDWYADVVAAEMAIRSSLVDGVPIETIYFGGGTPSLLSPAAVGRMMRAVRNFFDLSCEAEITLEANPGTVSADSLEGYRSAGVNRLSIGIQSFNDDLLLRLQRIHTRAEARDAFENARKAGFGNIGIDLIHSLPGQNLQSYERDLHAALDLNPDHLSIYGLTVEEGTPFSLALAQGALVLPSEDEMAEMFAFTCERLAHWGYEHYEISNFARAGFRSRHNQAYWRRSTYLGIGAGAHSFLGEAAYGTRWRNHEDLSAYEACVRAGKLEDLDRSILTLEDAVSESFFLGLRTLEGVDLHLLSNLFGDRWRQMFGEQIDLLLCRGMLRQSGNCLSIPPEKILMANQILVHFV